MLLGELLKFARRNDASDIHLSSNCVPMLRIYGEMVPVKTEKLLPEQILQIIHSIMTEQQKAEFRENLEIDFAISIEEGQRYRINAFNTITGPAAVLRAVPTQVKSIDDMGLPNVLKNIALLNKGLVLVTGPTGSGKSTTLAAIINHINENRSRHIITIEDPVEFVHESKRSLVNQREIGSSSKSFAGALRSALREDPDIIMVGELRDLESIKLAITAAETGHLVFATLHTSSASKTIDRIIDVFPTGDKDMVRTMLAGSLEAVITQLLLKTSDGRGRIAAHEILLANSGIRNLIREGKIPQINSMIQVGSKIGMKIMRDSIYKLLEEHIITKEEAQNALNMAKSAADGENGKK